MPARVQKFYKRFLVTDFSERIPWQKVRFSWIPSLQGYSEYREHLGTPVCARSVSNNGVDQMVKIEYLNDLLLSGLSEKLIKVMKDIFSEWSRSSAEHVVVIYI